MAVKKKILSGGELLTRLQRWLRLGWVEEHNTLGGWDDKGRRIKGRYYTSIAGMRFDDKECGPFPPADMMVEIAGLLMHNGYGRDEEWPRAMFTPPQSAHHIVMDIIHKAKREAAMPGAVEKIINTTAWGRYERLRTMEKWERDRRIKIEFQVNNKKDRSTAVVTFGQYERREDTSNFPSPEMVANIALALGAGADQQ